MNHHPVAILVHNQPYPLESLKAGPTGSISRDPQRPDLRRSWTPNNAN